MLKLFKNPMNFRKKIIIFFLLEEMEKNKYVYTKNWYKKIKKMSNEQFQEIFRMFKTVFLNIYKYIKQVSSKKTKNLKKKLLIFIFYVSHVSSYRKLREFFGISKSTLWRIVNEITNHLYSISVLKIKLPEVEEFPELKNGFLSRGNFDGTILALDGTHVEISRPNTNGTLYFNRKGFYSINYLCAVDFRCRFRFVTFGFGSAHDSRIFRNCSINEYANFINSTNSHIVADSAFRSFLGISTPNFESDLLNLELEKQRVIVENTFGIFKSKFKKFSNLIINGERDNYIKMFIATCLIHNLIIEFKDE